VVVCTYSTKRLELLRAALAGVVAQRRLGDELVIVVDHNPELLRLLRAEHPDDVVVENTGPRGLSGARNTGVEVAAGEVVVFPYDNATPRAGWLDRLVAPFADPSVAGTGGHAVPRWEAGTRPPWFPEELHWVVGCSFRGQAGGDVRNPIGCSMAIRADTLGRVGKFSTELGRVGTLPVGCEETELGLRINAAGGRIVLVDDSVVDHFVPAERASVRYVLRRCYAEGMSKAVVRRLAAETGPADGTLAPERRYLLTIVAAMVAAPLRALRERSVAVATPTLLLPASLVAAALGFTRASLRRGPR
jgi:GT2 family glycosyltransferase